MRCFSARKALSRCVNLLLLMLGVAMGFITLFAIQELLLMAAAYFIHHGVDGEVRGRYALITVRNVWLIAGGALLLGLAIAGFDYFVKRLDSARTRPWLLGIVFVELGVIALSWVVAGFRVA